jgi:hypothetical protein
VEPDALSIVTNVRLLRFEGHFEGLIVLFGPVEKRGGGDYFPLPNPVFEAKSCTKENVASKSWDAVSFTRKFSKCRDESGSPDGPWSHERLAMILFKIPTFVSLVRRDERFHK